MKLFSIQSLSVTLGAIALVVAPLSLQGRAENEVCFDPLAGIQLSDNQVQEIERLETQFEAETRQIDNISPEEEAQWEQANSEMERKVKELLSPQQYEQLGQLQQWAEQQFQTILPAFDEAADEPTLTSEQEAAFKTFDQEYERRLQAIISPEQMQQIDAIEEQFMKEMEAASPEVTPEQEAQFNAAQDRLEQELNRVLTPEQRQQLDRVNSTCN